MDRSKTIVGHLEELRRRLLVVIGCFLLFFAIPLIFPNFFDSYAARLLKFLFQHFMPKAGEFGLLENPKLIFTQPLEPVFAGMKVAAFLGLAAVSPVLAWQAYAFISPAFLKKDRTLLAYLSFGSLFFFAAGAVIAYLLLIPVTIDIFIKFGAAAGAVPMIAMGSFSNFLFWMIVVFSLPFELPLVIGMLARAGVVSAKQLRTSRKAAIMIILIFSALITPDPTPFSMLVLSACLILLYELGIIIAVFTGKGVAVSAAKRKKKRRPEA